MLLADLGFGQPSPGLLFFWVAGGVKMGVAGLPRPTSSPLPPAGKTRPSSRLELSLA